MAHSSQNWPHSAFKIPGFAANRRLSRNGLVGSAEIGFQDAHTSQLAMPESAASDRIAFACALLETGLRMCLPERNQDSTAFGAEQSVLRSPACLGTIAKYGHYSRISAQSEWNFSAVKTAWRSGKDSNPRYRSETCKSRRLRKLCGINWFRNSPADCLLPIRHAKQCGFAKPLEAKRWRLCG